MLPSHVLMALGLNEVQAHGSLRISLGRNSEEKDIEYIHNSIKEIIVRLREISPLWKKQKI